MTSVAANSTFDEDLARMQRDSDALIAIGHHPFTRLHMFNEQSFVSAGYHEFLMVSIRNYHRDASSGRLRGTEDAILEMCKPYWDFSEAYADSQFFIKIAITRDLRHDTWCLRAQMHLTDISAYESFLALLKLHSLPEWQSLDVK
jgi:hypothetical protein